MQEMGIESNLLKQILAGEKTIELRLGRGKFLKFRTGDQISLREDIYKDGELVSSKPDQAVVLIKQLLYFESFDEVFSAIDFRKALPEAYSAIDAIDICRKFYSEEEEEENGVVAIIFTLV